MKILSLGTATFLAFVLLSCSESGNHTENIPSPVESDKTVSLLPRKRDSELILNELYQDASDKNPELQRLNREIAEYDVESNDSLAGINKYFAYSTRYYMAGDNLVKSVKDSILKKHLEDLIQKSGASNKKATGKLTALMSSVDKSQISINDYYLALKLIVTLPIIENYQKENLPIAIKKIEKVAVKGAVLKQKASKAAEKYEGELD